MDFPFHSKDKLLVLRHFRLGHMPPAQYATEILNEKEFPVLVVEFGNLTENEKRVANPFPKIRLESRWVQFLPNSLRSSAIFFSTFFQLINLILKTGKPKLIVSHGISESTLAFLLNSFFKIPYIYHVHEVYTASKIRGFNRVLLLAEGVSLRRAKFLIFPEQERANIYEKQYSLLNPIYLVANCPRLTLATPAIDLRKKYSLPKKSFLVGYLGGIGETNAIREMILAISKTSNIYFLIWGFSEKAYLKRLRKLIIQHKLQDKVLLLGRVEKKLNHLSGLDASFCYYKGNELRTRHILTASNKFTESLCAGIPIFTSDSKEFTNFFKKYPVGKCLKSLKAKDIARSLESLKNDEAFRENASKVARELHKNLFNYEFQFREVLKAYQAFFPSSPKKNIKKAA